MQRGDNSYGTKQMSSLKRNAISVFGWFIFASLYYSLFYILKYIALQVHNKYPTFTLNGLTSSEVTVVILIIAFVTAFVLGFLAFALSLQLVVFPVSRWINLNVTNSKYPLILEWLVFFAVFYFVAVWPLFLIEDLIKLMAAAPVITNAIDPTWQVLVSLWLYRENVLARISISNNQLKNTELKMQNSTLT
jgi:hypothetical protein